MTDMNSTTSHEISLETWLVISGEHKDPSSVLGMHCNNEGDIEVRVFRPEAESIAVLDDISGTVYDMVKIHEAGFFEAVIRNTDFFSYKLRITDRNANTVILYDPYSFPPSAGDYDTYLFSEGSHHRIYDKLGSHFITLDGIKGTAFAVWAPCARRVSVVGSFNGWDGRIHQMRMLGSSGIWELFIPELTASSLYKYEIKTPSGELYLKADPFAFYSELRPGTASLTYDIGGYKWGDDEWMQKRCECDNMNKPVSIYEVHFGSWARVPGEGDRFLTYIELADRLVEYVSAMGFTHIELMPLTEHPFDGSWGYQITGYYSLTSRYGKPEEFMYFVDCCHRRGIGVIMDWVPAHFPKDGHGLARFDGTALYEHADRRQGEHPDWGTHIFNFGRNEVRNFLIANALFWFDKYHIDGLRVDAVASMLYLDYGKKHGEWVPNKWGGKENVDAITFMQQLNFTVYKYFPGVMMIAEESTSWALVTKPPYTGGLGFSHKWNMGWMNDFLKYAAMDPIYRKYHHDCITFSLMYAFSENFILVLSHDEVVHGKRSMIGKMPGDDISRKFAALRACYGYLYGHPGKKLLFMGNEFGQFIEWNYMQSLDWHLLGYEPHMKLQKYVMDLNKLYKTERALHMSDFSCDGFEWIDCGDSDHSIVSFMRKTCDNGDMLILVFNFTPVCHTGYRIGAPLHAYYKEIMNSDSAAYGGSNIGNCGGVQAESVPYHNRPYSLQLTIPPFGALMLKPEL